LKITFKKIPEENKSNYLIKSGDKTLCISDTKFVLNVKSGAKQFFFEGEIYYCVNNNNIFTLKKSEYEEFLKKQLEEFDTEKFINSVEGIYNCVYIDSKKNEIVIFCDYLNRKNFFYTESENTFVAATSLENIINEFRQLKYNQQGLLSYITLGYTPVYQTLYDGINRFNTNEYICITNGKILHEFFSESYSIEEYDNSFINKYDELISNSILSRSSENNFVLNSGGWDSTSIIYHLLQGHDKNKINSVVYETKLRHGDAYNIYETDKVKRISDYYGIKSEKIEIDFGNNKLIHDWESLRDELKNYHTYFFLDMPKTVRDIMKSDNNASVFSGEASDSIHNFGFSQFVSVTYGNRHLREYGDKMKSYLFGPTFYSKILNNSYSEDKVFQFFKYYFGETNFESTKDLQREEILISYFRSFMLSGERVPFAKSINSEFAKNSLTDNFNANSSEKIFDKLAAEISEKKLYYSLLQLYRSYHFHSPQIEVKHSPLRSEGENCKIPFLDSALLKFMYSMPENWGRGLGLKQTKYPLKYLARNKWHIPVHILEEKGAHSYIAESDKKWNYSGGNWSLASETIYNSVFGEHYKSILSEVKLEKYFSSEYFHTGLMQKAVDEFVEGKQNLNQTNFIYKLGMLFFIGLYE
jgi:hypothetical protein